MAVTVKITVVWNVTPYNLIYSSHFQDGDSKSKQRMEAAGISQTLSNIYLTTRHDIHKFSYIELSHDRVQ
jgi:hypothetical protein